MGDASIPEFKQISALVKEVYFFWENVNGVDQRGYEEFASGASTFPLRLI